MTGLGPPPVDQVPWRSSGLQVILSDLLYPVEPRLILLKLAVPGTSALLIAPFDDAEIKPAWRKMELIEDCEDGRRFQISGDQRTRSAYERAYRAHFEQWTRAAAVAGVSLLGVGSNLPLARALLSDESPLASVG